MSDGQYCAIAISRQMGSGGTYLGYLLAKKLDFRYVDREILRQAAQVLNADVGYLAGIDGKCSGLLENILRGFSMGTPEATMGFPLSRPVYNRELFTLECRIMNDMADHHNVVIIGRGGFHALRKRSRVIRVFCHAPLDFRTNRLMKVQNLTDVRQARAEIEESDASRAGFIKEMTGTSWTDAPNYHLCIDLSKISIDASVEMIAGMMKG